MGIVLIKIKIMPVSPETDLEEIKNKSHDVITDNKGRNIRFNEEPVAFGLKAVIVSFDLDEKNPLDYIEEDLRKIENVNSIQVIDMRRAFG